MKKILEKKLYKMTCSDCGHKWEAEGMKVDYGPNSLGICYHTDNSYCPKCDSKHSEMTIP